MDVIRILTLLRSFFEDRGEPFALVGGLALLAKGAPRATFDCDILAGLGSQDALIAFLEQAGWKTLASSAAFSNHQHGDRGLGRLDVIYVGGATAEAVFAGCAPVDVGGLHALVPRAEHLVAMKAQSFAKDQGRYTDLADLRFLLSLPGIDLDEARGYLEAEGLGEIYDRLRAK